MEIIEVVIMLNAYDSSTLNSEIFLNLNVSVYLFNKGWQWQF